MAADTKDALDTAHAGTLIICRNDLFFLLFGVSTARFEDTAFAAILAPELLTAAGIVTVLDNIGTATTATHMNYCFCNHAITIPSLRLDHHQLFM